MFHIKFGFNRLMFEYYGHIHVYSPGAGTDNPIESFFHKHKSSVHLHTPSKFLAINYISLILPIQMVDLAVK